jgi:hypothetical protein
MLEKSCNDMLGIKVQRTARMNDAIRAHDLQSHNTGETALHNAQTSTRLAHVIKQPTDLITRAQCHYTTCSGGITRLVRLVTTRLVRVVKMASSSSFHA